VFSFIKARRFKGGSLASEGGNQWCLRFGGSLLVADIEFWGENHTLI
jgi:hypothetical protein